MSIGGSIAGMLAARVLADRFESVTIVETDKLPLQPQMRKGVPQSVQPHVLFARGYRILEELSCLQALWLWAMQFVPYVQFMVKE